jgi:TPR repeat protein
MIGLGVMLGTRRRRRQGSPTGAGVVRARGIANLAALNGGTPTNSAEPRALLEKSAKANSAEAEFQLGLMAANGTGGPQDYAAARALFEKAAEQGHAEAMVWFGAFAQLGRGGPEGKKLAKSYFEKAAALGNEEARKRLKQIECPYVLKDKKGETLTNLCF